MGERRELVTNKTRLFKRRKRENMEIKIGKGMENRNVKNGIYWSRNGTRQSIVKTTEPL